MLSVMCTNDFSGMNELSENEIAMVAGGDGAEDVLGGGVSVFSSLGAFGAAAEASTYAGAVLLGASGVGLLVLGAGLIGYGIYQMQH